MKLHQAADDIEDARNMAARMHNPTEHSRLVGKAEGVRLALSYVEEIIRVGA